MAVHVTVVLVFIDAEGVLGLILVDVVLVVVPLKRWRAYVGALLLHAVPCL